MADPSSDSLRLWLEVPERVAAGEPVPMALRAENTTGRSLDLHLTGRPIAFDLIVTDEDGRVVWRRLADEVIAAVLRLETLGPGDTLTLEGRWDQRSNAGDPVSPGVYSARGELPTDGDPLVTPEVALRIVSG